MVNILKSISHAAKSGTHAVGHLLSGGEKKIEKAIGTVYKDGKHAVNSVYKDGKSAVSYTGKHVIKDVDSISSSFSNPIYILGAAVVAAVVFSKL